MKPLRGIAYRMLETPIGYRAIQTLNRPTVSLVRSLINRNVKVSPQQAILDLGCGTGNYRNFFSGEYYGIDINAQYIESCRNRHSGDFSVMDATDLDFACGRFDHVATLATTHHLSDEQVERMVTQALRVLRPGGQFHLVDAILPESWVSLFKNVWFRLDRGCYPRKRRHLVSLVNRVCPIDREEIVRGLMHDVIYLRLEKRMNHR